MIQARNYIFETNSSSTHSMVLTTEDKMNRWEKGDLYYTGDCWDIPDAIKEYVDDEGFVEAKIVREAFKDEIDENEDLDYYLKDNYEIDSYDYWGEDYEQDCFKYTSPSGDKLASRCYYGNDY